MKLDRDLSLFSDYVVLPKLLNNLQQLREQKDAQSLPSADISLSKFNQKILIFGTGEAGKRFYQMFHKKYQVVGFVDNDKSKHGTLLNNLPIFAPTEIHTVSYDVVYIASQYYRAIYQQLVNDLGVPAFKLKY